MIRIKRDEALIETILSELDRFVADMDDLIAKLK